MEEFSVLKKVLFISFWRTSNVFPFGGIRLNLWLIITNFMIGVITHFYVLGDG